LADAISGVSFRPDFLCGTFDPDKPMRARIGSILILSVLALPACSSQGGTPSLETEDQKASYSLGFQMGMQLEPAETHMEMDAFMAGVRHGMSGAEPVMPRLEIQAALQALTETVNREEGERLAAEGEKNQTEGAAFHAENLEKDGVVTTESGLQYEVIQEGDGPRPEPSDRVSIHYKGTLLDGTQFDSSYDGGEPVVFGVSGVISGFSEGLQLMAVGSHFRFFIPSNLAYGAQGSPPNIGPNATLIFEVEMLEIVE
jgi:FKBP-type peptidyl-prolyl cis-trans isomerase